MKMNIQYEKIKINAEKVENRLSMDQNHSNKKCNPAFKFSKIESKLLSYALHIEK